MEKIGDLEEGEGQKVNLEEIGIGHKNRNENALFGGSNLNNALALQFQKQANLRALMVSLCSLSVIMILDSGAAGIREEETLPINEL